MPKETEDADGFLSRWSRRKLHPEDAAPDPAAEMPPAPVGHNSAPSEDALSDAELLEKYALPDPQAMGEGDDFAAFMKSGIPQRLRRLALRRLWMTNPALANIDGLVDYGEDFTDAATVVENLQTVYEVGKGAAARVRAELDALAARRAEAVEEEGEGAVSGTPEESAAPALPEDAPDTADIAMAEPETPVEAAPQPRPLPMRFTFD